MTTKPKAKPKDEHPEWADDVQFIPEGGDHTPDRNCACRPRVIGVPHFVNGEYVDTAEVRHRR